MNSRNVKLNGHSISNYIKYDGPGLSPSLFTIPSRSILIYPYSVFFIYDQMRYCYKRSI